VHQARVALTAATRPITAPVEPPVAFVVVPRQQAAAVSRAATQGSPTAAVTAPQATLAGFPGLQDAIINGYNLVIPWVDYGVNLAQYAVGWIPVASFFAPQIGIFYYDLIRPIVTRRYSTWPTSSAAMSDWCRGGVQRDQRFDQRGHRVRQRRDQLGPELPAAASALSVGRSADDDPEDRGDHRRADGRGRRWGGRRREARAERRHFR
jgi:hypothetical protein